MSLRELHPENRSSKRFSLTFALGRSARSISLPPLLFYIIVGVLPVLGLWYLFATVYLIFRDDMLASLMNRQTEMQYAYEDRISTLHTQIDQLTSRRLLDEAALNTKMEDLSSRQVRLERRSAVVASLAERVLPKADAKIAASTATQTGEVRAKQASSPHSSANPLLTGAYSQSLPAEVSAFAPVEGLPAETAPHKTAPAKPRPDGFDLRHSQDSEFLPPAAADKSSDRRDPGDGESTMAQMDSALDHIERDQNRFVAQLQTPLIGEMARVRTVLAEAGISADRIALRGPSSAGNKTRGGAQTNAAQDAIGGPFVPVNLDADGSPFERAAISLQDTLAAVEHLRRTISSVPLRKPLNGDPDVTSGFGARVDPFFGRPAMHTGIDLREDYGTDVHATATGKVALAGPDGGYGNLIELDHGNGLATRYAHLSAILVSEGQLVQAGQVIGRIGMTGRTTGPHLHYETRIDGEPVDPLRFLKAGARLFSVNASLLAASATQQD